MYVDVVFFYCWESFSANFHVYLWSMTRFSIWFQFHAVGLVFWVKTSPIARNHKNKRPIETRLGCWTNLSIVAWSLVRLEQKCRSSTKHIKIDYYRCIEPPLCRLFIVCLITRDFLCMRIMDVFHEMLLKIGKWWWRTFMLALQINLPFAGYQIIVSSGSKYAHPLTIHIIWKIMEKRTMEAIIV